MNEPVCHCLCVTEATAVSMVVTSWQRCICGDEGRVQDGFSWSLLPLTDRGRRGERGGCSSITYLTTWSGLIRAKRLNEFRSDGKIINTNPDNKTGESIIMTFLLLPHLKMLTPGRRLGLRTGALIDRVREPLCSAAEPGLLVCGGDYKTLRTLGNLLKRGPNEPWQSST